MQQTSTFRFAAFAHTLRQAAILAGVLAGVALLAGCFDNPNKPFTAPSSVRFANSTSGTYGNGNGHAAKVIVCVDASSPAGTYKFRNSSWNSGIALTGYGAYDNGGWYDQGDGGDALGAAGGTDSWLPAKYDNSEYTVAVGQCVVVLTRVKPSDHYAIDNIDDWQAVNVTSSTMPAGVNYDHTDCDLDLGVVAAQPTPCGTNASTTRAFANYNHGSQITFVFKTAPPPPPPCVLGYPYTSSNSRTSVAFNESEVLSAFGRGNGEIRAWYTDENALTLGVRQLFIDNKTGPDVTTNYTIALMSGNPSSATGNPVAYGSTLTSGEGAAIDAAGRPLFPAMFVTDLTVNGLSSKAGDWQQGGVALAPNALYGTWKAAAEKVNKTVTPAVTTITPDVNPAKNHMNVGPGGINPPSTIQDQGYSTEIVWKISNIPGYDPTHTYRVQFMVHDGDQNKTGGDVGQACINIGPGTPDNFVKIN